MQVEFSPEELFEVVAALSFDAQTIINRASRSITEHAAVFDGDVLRRIVGNDMRALSRIIPALAKVNPVRAEEVQRSLLNIGDLLRQALEAKEKTAPVEAERLTS